MDGVFAIHVPLMISHRLLHGPAIKGFLVGGWHEIGTAAGLALLTICIETTAITIGAGPLGGSIGAAAIASPSRGEVVIVIAVRGVASAHSKRKRRRRRDLGQDIEQIARRAGQPIKPRHHQHVAGLKLSDRLAQFRPIGPGAAFLLAVDASAASRL